MQPKDTRMLELLRLINYIYIQDFRKVTFVTMSHAKQTIFLSEVLKPRFLYIGVSTIFDSMAIRHRN